MTRIIGTSDEIGTCDCCGRTDLKKTIAIEIDGEISHFGSECAARRMGQRSKSSMERQAKLSQIAGDAKAANGKFIEELICDERRLNAAFDAQTSRISFASFIEQLRASI